MFSIITPKTEAELRRTKCFKFIISNWINLLYLYLGGSQEIRGHKVVPVMLYKFYFLILSSLQLFTFVIAINQIV